MTGQALPRAALCFVALAVAALYAHAISYMPIDYGDQFQEIHQTLIMSPAKYFEGYQPGPLFRPGEVLWRYLIIWLFGPYPASYNYFQILFLAATALVAVSLVPCRNWLDAGAGITAITFLFGHHAYVAVLEANITFSNGLALLLMMLALHVIQSRGGVGAQVFAIALSVAAVLTKEVGLVVPVAFVVAALVGFPGIRRATGGVLVALTVAYLAFRFITLAPFEGGTGAGTPHSIAERLSNLVASPVMMVTGDPYDGDWSQFFRRDFYPWRIIRLGLGFATVTVILVAFSLRKEAAREFPETELVDRKWIILLLAVIAASSALGFQYTRHRFGAMALPLAFALLDRSLRIIVWSLSRVGTRSWVIATVMPLLVLFSLGWAMRAADGFFVLRYTGSKTMVDWIEHYQAYRDYESKDPSALPYLDSFFWAAEDLPWPTIQHDSSFVKLWLGEEDVLNR